MAVKIVEGRDLIYEVKKYDLILVGTSILNNLGNGFQYKVGLNFPEVFDASKTASRYGDIRKLGKVDVVEIKPMFALCYITKSRHHPKTKPDCLEYDALKKCLTTIKTHYGNKKIASTILGHSPFEGGGDKEKVIELFNEILGDCNVTLYDYEQQKIDDEKRASWSKVVEHAKQEDYEEYKKKYFWEWGVGIYEPMPKDKTLKEIKSFVNSLKENRKNLVYLK